MIMVNILKSSVMNIFIIIVFLDTFNRVRYAWVNEKYILYTYYDIFICYKDGKCKYTKWSANLDITNLFLCSMSLTVKS